MSKNILRLLLLLVSFCWVVQAFAERDDCDFNTKYDVGISKKVKKRWEFGFTESLTLSQNSTEVQKVSSKVDASFQIIRKFFKVGVAYYAMAKHNDENYYFNQRFQGYLNGKYTVRRFSFALKTLYQMSYRPEKEEKKQWENYWRNKLSVTFKVPKIPMYPYVSAEMFFQTNNYKGNEIDMMRYEGGLKYEFNKRNALELYYRYEDEFNKKNPMDVSSVGIAYQFSL